MTTLSIFKKMASDPVIQSLSETLQRRLMMIAIMQADIDVLELDENDRELVISTFLRISTDELKSTQKTLISKNLINENWQLVERKKTYSKGYERVKRYREKSKTNDNVIKPVINLTNDNAHDNANDNAPTKTAPIQNASENKKLKKGTRLDPNATLEKEWTNWALNNGINTEYEVKQVYENFKDYWVSLTGQNAVKLDWFATWRNWVRRHLDYNRKSDKKSYKASILPKHVNAPGRNYTEGTYLREDGTLGF